MRKPTLWVLLLLVLVAALVAASRWVRYVRSGDLAVARSGDSSRYLPPGLHLVNPWRETLDLIPSGSFPISGIAALVTADGIPIRVPFSARVSLLPREFEAAMGALGGQHPRGVVTRGMEGALASVVAGLVAAPVVAVPTSVGYGASFGGIVPLLSMLNSCAANVCCVNIDDGFGAAVVAAAICR